MRSVWMLRGGLAASLVLTGTAAGVGAAAPWQSTPAPVRHDAAPPPRALAARYTPADPVLAPDTTAASTAPVPTTAGLTALLGTWMANKALGTGVGAVGDAATGTVLYADGATTPAMPASTSKLVTAVTALQLLGPEFRLRTRVVSGASPNEIVLVGGGDPTLSTGPVPPGDPGFQPASMQTLAAETAQALHAAGRTTVTLAYDTSLYAGPDWQSTWDISDQLGSIAPVDALQVDEGRTDPSADSSGRVSQPAIVAAQDFGRYLSADGITVAAQLPETTAPAGSATLASVASPPLADLVQHMLTVSDNALAEALARQVAIAMGQPASFVGATDAVRTEIGRLGVDTAGMAMVDDCGLSHADRMTVLTLLQTLSLAASSGHPRLRAAVTGLPVGNFSGTLDELGRYTSGVSAAGAGLVRAKTGTIDSVNGLAGLVRDADGRLLVFAFLSNGNSDGLLAIRQLDDMATMLLSCGCH